MSAFEAMYRGWGFVPLLGLFRAFFKILKANNGFLSFCDRNGLIIFISHKDSINYWVEHFTNVEAKGSFDWGLELGWGAIDIFCNSFPFLFEWEQLYFTRITSLLFKYNVFKCLGIRSGENYYYAGTDHSFCCCLLLSLSFCVFGLFLFYFAAFIVPLDKISTFHNFSLNWDAIRVSIKAFTIRKTMDVVTEMLRVEPILTQTVLRPSFVGAGMELAIVSIGQSEVIPPVGGGTPTSEGESNVPTMRIVVNLE